MIRIWSALFSLVAHLGIRGRLGQAIEDAYYAAVRDLLVDEYRSAKGRVGLTLNALPWWCWSDRDGGAQA